MIFIITWSPWSKRAAVFNTCVPKIGRGLFKKVPLVRLEAFNDSPASGNPREYILSFRHSLQLFNCNETVVKAVSSRSQYGQILRRTHSNGVVTSTRSLNRVQRLKIDSLYRYEKRSEGLQTSEVSLFYKEKQYFYLGVRKQHRTLQSADREFSVSLSRHPLGLTRSLHQTR